MLETMTHWQLDVDRGPDWLFVRINPPAPNDEVPVPDAAGLAEAIWDVMQSNFCYRVVVEMENVSLLYSTLIGQLILLSKRVLNHNGLLRLSQLSDGNQEVLHMCRLEGALPNFLNRADAVMGYRPTQPR